MKTSLTAFALICMLPALAAAGSLDAPGAPASGSGMPTTADIYNRLNSGAAISVPGAFQEPAAGPTAGTGRTLSEIGSRLPAPDNLNGATASEVASGKTFWGLRTDGTWGLSSGAIATGANVTGANGLLSFPIPNALYTGGKTATASDSNLVPGNIKSGVSIFGVSGTANQASGTAAAADVLTGKTFSNGSATGVNGAMANIGAVTLTPGTSAQTIAAGYHNGSGSVLGDGNLVAGNIRNGVTLFGVSGALNVMDTTASAPAAAADIASGKQAYVNGALVNGTSTAATGHVAERICATGWGGANCDVCAGQWSGASCNVCPTGWSGSNCDIIAKPFPGGTPPSYASTHWKCVLDSTGLTWEVKTTDGGLHDWNSTYTWYNTAVEPNSGTTTPGSCIGARGCDTAKYVVAVNNERLCGYSDWRMPSISELQGLIVTGSYPAIDTAYFPNTQASDFWSGSSYVPNPFYAWYVDFLDGFTSALNKSFDYYVRLVRGGP